MAIHRDILCRIDAEAGSLFWVDPERRQIITRRRYPERPDEWSGGRAYVHVDVGRDELALCRIENGMLWTPARHRDDVIEAERKRAEQLAEEARRRAVEAEQERRERAAAEERARRARARDAAKAAHDERMANSRAWARYKRLIADASRPLPPIVEDRLESDAYVGMHPAHWHALVFAKFLNRRAGERTELKEIIDFVAQRSGDEARWIERSVRAYLYHLERYGYIRADRDDDRRTWILVRADADTSMHGLAADPGWEARQERVDRTLRAWMDDGGD